VAVPLLVVVTGMPSSGKSTVADGLAGRLALPLVAKDEIKESLYASLGAESVTASERLGTAAYALTFDLARAMLASGVSLIVEANFFREQEPDFASLPEHRLVQVHCHAPFAVLLDRYANRSRHAGHHDAEKIKELPARFESGAHSPLRLRGDLVQLDTTEAVDLDALAARLRELL
jgi:predicted kinase